MDVPTAAHLPGGNWFDDVRLDIEASLETQERWLREVPRRSIARGRVANLRARKRLAATYRLNLREALVDSGIEHAWFDEFHDYWRNALSGRALAISDFHALRFHYRRHAQHTEAFAWETPEQHVANWQTPENINATFHFVYRSALDPIRSAELVNAFRPGMRVLEYGCSIAPSYRTWRSFFSHLGGEWVLADIGTFPFHYARHVYGRDEEARFVWIRDLKDPLADQASGFDLIVVQEVFEHLDRPRFVAEYLLDRLAPGGSLLFDYPLVEPLGHNTPAGMEERAETLAYLGSRLDLPSGAPLDRDLPLTLARLR